MKVEVQYRYTLLGGTTAESFADHAETRAREFYDGEPDEIEVVVTQTGHGVSAQYRGECVAVKRVETER